MHPSKLSKLLAISVTSALLTINAMPAAFAAGPGDLNSHRSRLRRQGKASSTFLVHQ